MTRMLVALLPLALALLGLPRATLAAEKLHAAAAAPATMTFTVVNVEYEGTKMWVPGTIVVKKGTKVALKLVNNVPSDPNQHGFAIPAYEIAEIVNRGEPKSVEFTANKVGVFPIICQLHPGHVGGELVVVP
ncbi:MAG TPA: cupredoxin domain-containing protein [Candidatus Binatia bacterium]|nr:cupredoxin domain-containing protein [Candidatus Binatia bacterium]